MILGTGIDIVDLMRFKLIFEKHEQRFLNKFFTKNEILCGNGRINFFAGRFAAKEAISKAFGCGFGQKLKWLDLEILPNEHGKPILTKNNILINILEANFDCHISISHEKNYAVASAVLVK